MREIKFRGLTADGEFIYGDLIHDKPNSTRYYNEFSQRISWSYNNQPVQNGTIGQYTGLKDKNGVEIYEGDIVEIKHDERDDFTTSIFKITTDVRLWGYAFDWELIKGYFCSTHILENDYSNVEVIGNIYEDPELLEVD